MPLSYHFWNSGVTIRHGEEFESIEGLDDGVIFASAIRQKNESRLHSVCQTVVPAIPMH